MPQAGCVSESPENETMSSEGIYLPRDEVTVKKVSDFLNAIPPPAEAFPTKFEGTSPFLMNFVIEDLAYQYNRSARDAHHFILDRVVPTQVGFVLLVRLWIREKLCTFRAEGRLQGAILRFRDKKLEWLGTRVRCRD